jgi:hypothetical protein
MPTFAFSVDEVLSSADPKGYVGHLSSLKIGPVTLNADMQVPSPPIDGGADTVKIVGPLMDISWNEKSQDPIYLSAAISSANRAMVEALLMQGPDASDADVTFSFVVYGYDFGFDDGGRKYFEAFKEAGDEPLKGRLSQLSGGRLALRVDNEEMSRMDGQVTLFPLAALFAPDRSSQQTITHRMSPTIALALAWGGKEGDAERSSEAMAATGATIEV